MRTFKTHCIIACLLSCNLLLIAQSQQGMAFKAAAIAQFSVNPSLPSCGAGAVQDGNPSKGPSAILIKFKAGCVIPWHWHSPNERLIIISGSAKADMKGAQTTLLKQGDFLLLPSKEIHRFTAITAVELFDISDSSFDIHYVDADGKEVSAGYALKRPDK